MAAAAKGWDLNSGSHLGDGQPGLPLEEPATRSFCQVILALSLFGRLQNGIFSISSSSLTSERPLGKDKHYFNDKKHSQEENKG
jgi:hypothetical protein